MSKLQELLDEKFPLLGNMSPSDLQYRIWLRQAFTEGYNADKEESKQAITRLANGTYPGRDGCMLGDTLHDSIAVAYGYKIALQDADVTLKNL